MSDALIDETILNDDNDDDLDYNIDPKEEHALLQEEPDMLEQDYIEDDILDLNIDYDQMDVQEDKNESTPPEKLKREKILRNNDKTPSLEKKNIQDFKNQRPQQFKKVPKIQKRPFSKTNQGNASAPRTIRRSKTLFINPRFGGPVHVNSRQFAWESPPPAFNNEYQKSQNYIQPWVTGNPQNQHISQQQQVPLNFNPSAFVPQSQQVMYMQPQPFQQTMQPVYQSFVQQPTPVMNQNMLLNQQPTVQMSQCPNQYLFHPQPQVQVIQQVPEPSKIPVHQRLGIPGEGFHQSVNNFSQPSNLEMQYDSKNFQNNFVVDNQNTNQFSQPNFVNHKPTMNSQNPFVRNQYNKKFNTSSGGNQSRNISRNQCNYKNYNNNNKIVPTRDPQFIMQEHKNIVEVLKQEKKEIEIKHELHSARVIPEAEVEYQKLIEMQKLQREEVLRKKEENRLKSLAQKKRIAAVPKRVNLPVHKNFNPKRYYSRTQQSQQLTSQNYTNIIVITGNDSQSHPKQRFNKSLERPVDTFNSNHVFKPERTVISNQISSTNNLQAQPAMSVNVDVHSTDLSPEFLSTRSVSTQDDLANTNIVVVKNLASCTNEPKILKLCREIGVVQKLRMEKAERQATIHFKTVASAHAFYKKFRRHMIDLSMIQVDLVPCEVSS